MFNTPPMTRQRCREQAEAAAAAAPCDSTFVQPPPSAIGTNKSKRSSTSSIARRKELEFKAAEEKARIDKELIDKRLAADLALIDAESEGRSDALTCSEIQDHVSNWLEVNEHVSTSSLPEQLEPVAQCSDRAAPVQATDVLQLAHAIKNMVDQSSTLREERLLSRLATPQALPLFSGDCFEWLHFKSEYEESSLTCGFTESENLSRLRRALRGDAKEAVTDLLIGNTPPATVMDALQLKFGQPELIIITLTAKLRRLPPLPPFYQRDLINFAMKVNNCLATIRALQQDDYLRNPELASAITSKLPSTLLGKWTDFAYERLRAGEPKLVLLAEFLKREAERVSITGTLHQPHDFKRPVPADIPVKRAIEPYRNPPRPILTTVSAEPNGINCKFCKKAEHDLPDCRIFRRAMRKDRWRYVKVQKLCTRCLIERHDISACSAPVCDFEQCGQPHHRLLHYKTTTTGRTSEATNDEPIFIAEPALEPQAPPRSTSAADATVAHVAVPEEVAPAPEGDVMLKVVAVTLRGPRGEVQTYALLDDAASASVIDDDLSEQLGLKCESASDVKFIDAFGLEVCQSDAPRVRADIAGQDNNYHNLCLRRVSKLSLPVQNLSFVNNISIPQLSTVKDIVCKERVVPRLLIGEDNYFLIAPLEIIHGDRNSPYATRCMLGWSIHGYCGRACSSAPHVSHNVCHITHTDTGIDSSTDFHVLNELTKQSFASNSVRVSTAADCCLNDYQLTGPDLYNTLLGIMLRFCENGTVVIDTIRGLSSNSKEGLEAIPANTLAQSAVQFKDGATNMTVRTPGLMLHPADDTFSTKVSLDQIPFDILNGSVPPTKIKMLSIIQSKYDIHGFLTPLTIKRKVLLKDVQRSRVNWKCRIGPKQHTRWKQWLDELKQLESLRIPRSDPRYYKTFVAQRLGEIDELTAVQEWRDVPSSLNIVDLATKTKPLRKGLCRAGRSQLFNTRFLASRCSERGSCRQRWSRANSRRAHKLRAAATAGHTRRLTVPYD